MNEIIFSTNQIEQIKTNYQILNWNQVILRKITYFDNISIKRIPIFVFIIRWMI